MTQEEENQHIKKLKDAGFDCGSSQVNARNYTALETPKRSNSENLIKTRQQ